MDSLGGEPVLGIKVIARRHETRKQIQRGDKATDRGNTGDKRRA